MNLNCLYVWLQNLTLRVVTEPRECLVTDLAELQEEGLIVTPRALQRNMEAAAEVGYV